MLSDCVRVSQLRDQPDHWLITNFDKQGRDTWRVLRKPDGTFWYVKAMHLFPPSGGTLQVDTGDQVTDEDFLTSLESYYNEGQKEEQNITFEFDTPDPMASLLTDEEPQKGSLRKNDEMGTKRPDLDDEEQDWIDKK